MKQLTISSLSRSLLIAMALILVIFATSAFTTSTASHTQASATAYPLQPACTNSARMTGPAAGRAHTNITFHVHWECGQYLAYVIYIDVEDPTNHHVIQSSPYTCVINCSSGDHDYVLNFTSPNGYLLCPWSSGIGAATCTLITIK